MPTPRFHALLFIQDEADIIAQTLGHLAMWCDAVHVFDTGSRDETWDIVMDAASEDRRIVPEFKGEFPFHSGVRAWGFERVRARIADGDWVVRADADEFYHISPPDFIGDRLRRADGRVCAHLYDFVLTTRDIAAWEAGQEGVADRVLPIETRRRVWRINEWSELRLFRYRRHMRWRPWVYNPTNGGLLAGPRIPIRHYQCRDPLQLRLRCAVRNAAARAGGLVGPHWKIEDWRTLVVDEHAPDLRTWNPGEPLPPITLTNHLSPPPVRAAQVALYQTRMVRVLDRLRSPWNPACAPAVTPPLFSS